MNHLPGSGGVADPIRVLLVDDSLVVRRMLERLMSGEPGIEVVGTAASGEEGLKRFRELRPQVIVLDVEMPGMNGLDVVRAVRAEDRTVAIVMFSALTDRGAKTTLEAFSLGATDYAVKPSASSDATEQLRRELIARIRVHARRRFGTGGTAVHPLPSLVRPAAPAAGTGGPASTPAPAPAPSPAAPSRVARPGRRAPEILAVGCSTGGPSALADFFLGLERPLRVPIVVVQHMPKIFTRILAERLDRDTPIPTVEAQGGERPEPGRAYLAPGGQHMVLARHEGGAQIRLNDDPPVNFCKPAVDPMFESVVGVHGAAVLAVILTGMGDDGLRGSRAVRAAGGVVLAQDEASSVVWGMPGAVCRAGLAEASMPPRELGREVARRIGTLVGRGAA